MDYSLTTDKRRKELRKEGARHHFLALRQVITYVLNSQGVVHFPIAGVVHFPFAAATNSQ